MLAQKRTWTVTARKEGQEEARRRQEEVGGDGRGCHALKGETRLKRAECEGGDVTGWRERRVGVA